ncbi:hypothetical protein BMETH_69_4 [methanotrophic bacterial endosymbiont of Bathymodiolus sp.]|nr:hypothetical protein BMETH_69_4 [methanotrophic bacterial endosymbiont of Bathymodiolus sp.]
MRICFSLLPTFISNLSMRLKSKFMVIPVVKIIIRY